MIDGMGRNAPAWLAAAPSSGAGPRSPAGVETAAPATGRSAAPPRFGAVVRDLAATPPVDTARVAALRSAIASGSYAVDADAIAGRMLAFYGSGRG